MRVLIVDDHPVTRDGLRSALDGLDDIEVVGEAANGEDAVAAAKELAPDLVFMDVQMPGMDGLEAAKVIRIDHPDTKVILFTVEESRAAVAEAMQAGVSGYLLKDVTGAELLDAARQAMEGKAVIHPALTRLFIEESQLRPARTQTPLSEPGVRDPSVGRPRLHDQGGRPRAGDLAPHREDAPRADLREAWSERPRTGGRDRLPAGARRVGPVRMKPEGWILRFGEE